MSHIDGAALGLVWVLPFAGLLLSIAALPLVAGKFWHSHHGKVAALWALAFLVPLAVIHGIGAAIEGTVHTALHEYLPFILLLLALYVVSGGIRLSGAWGGTPLRNTGTLAAGTLLASIAGTTGASMLLIRPLIAANRARRRNVHVFVFFIFLVGNIGGALTPLGDPPLFLGFLEGVAFFWPTTHLLVPMLALSFVLLLGFFALDSYLYRADGGRAPKDREKLKLAGGWNVVLLGVILGAVLLSGVWDPDRRIVILGSALELQDLARDVILAAAAALSFAITPSAVHKANEFSWFPILEVAKLFAGLFLTIMPAIAILKAGSHGALAPLIALLTRPDGLPHNGFYFWLTGGLSSFLDNAPTYLMFFNTAGGDAEQLMGPLAGTLVAISAGAVFMGANTYIGNAPNFMVKSICEHRGIAMPSFFAYMAWSGAILLPLFAVLSLVLL